MFVVASLIILVFSFLIALVSLLREQRKAHKINQQHANYSMDEASHATLPVKPVVERIEPKEEVAKQLVEEPIKEPIEASTTKKRVDEETVPFPWEVKAGAHNVVPEPQQEIQQADDRFPNISKPSMGLNGSVSLKDLKK